MRGQGYDNGSNMKGQYKGVSGRVLREYPREFYSTCGCHSLNLALCDIEMITIQAKSFFGVKVNKVSKILQNKDMDINACITLLQGLIHFFEEYRNNGFENAKDEAVKIALEMGVEPTFRETRVRRKKRFIDVSTSDEPIQVAEDFFRVNYFLHIVDTALSSLNTRFEQFKKYDDVFGYLFNLSRLRKMEDESVKNACVALETYLKDGDD
ncbi:uncharacterized protein LOC141718660 [Apium graveolens]|uniref:uncharacterized protein LOC141718660 n=1 Tax=Apium graveolens TaxID=4045 RepID=UPI003D792234